MSSLVKEDLAKRLFGPRRLRLQEFIEVEGSGAGRCYLCAAGTRGCVGPGDPHGAGGSPWGQGIHSVLRRGVIRKHNGYLSGYSRIWGAFARSLVGLRSPHAVPVAQVAVV